MKKIDLTGERFGTWIVIRKALARKGSTRWMCKCDCGVIKELTYKTLVTGRSNSCRSCYVSQTRLEYGLSSKKKVYSNYKRKAENRGIKFKLSFEEFLKITDGDCFYCGDKPSNYFIGPRSHGGFTYQGIDRKDNSKDYTIDNVVSCCKICNMSKKNMSYDQFIAWIKRLSKHRVWKR